MKTSPRAKASLLNLSWALLLTALIGGGLGWWCRHSAQSKTLTHKTAVTGEASRKHSRTAGANTLPHTALEESSIAVQKRIATAIARLSTANTDDMVDMIGKIGALTRMTDAEIRMAWDQLAAQSPTKTFGGSLTAMYLWSRMTRMGERVAPPEGWGVEEFKKALESEHARRNMDQVLARLESGGALSDTERRVAFSQAVRTDPINAVKLLCRVTRPEDYQRDAQYMVDAMNKPETRAAVMAEVRKWQANGGSVTDSLCFLAKNWINRDPADVERWLQQPGQADIKDAMMNEVINARTMANAGEAWAWSQSSSLSDERRRYTLSYSSQHLANENPEEGMRLIADLKDPDDRREVIGKFGPILAGDDFDQWKQWRNTLSPAEQNVANESAFHVWARRDVNAAVEWLNAQPSGEAKNGMIMTLISVYAGQDPRNAVQWIRSIPQADDRRAAVSQALAHVGFDDLERTRIILSGLGSN